MSKSSENIASFLHPEKYAYRVVSDGWEWWQQRGDNPLSMNIIQFQTYGDGTTQHSGAWMPQVGSVVDVCLSAAGAIMANPEDAAWRSLTLHDIRIRKENLEFAMSVLYEEGKRRYYSLDQRKISASESKRHDKRWNLIEPCHDGTPGSGLNILMGECRWPWLERLGVLLDLHDIRYQRWEEIIPSCKDWEQSDQWVNALRVYRWALEAHERLDSARRSYNTLAETMKTAETVSA